jgi:hypothetical protein
MPDEDGPARGRRRLYTVARVALPLAGVGLLAYLVWLIGWDDLVTSLSRIGPLAAVTLLVLGLAESLADAEALRRAMLGRVKLGWTMASNSAGTLVNLAIPFEAGELVKAALLRQHSSDSRVLSGVVVWNYVWKVAKPLLVLLVFVSAQLLGHAFGQRLFWPLLIGVLVSFLPYLLLRTLIRLRPAERVMKLLGRLPLLRRKAPRWVQAASRLDGEVRDFWIHHPGAYLGTFTFQILGRVAGLATVAVLAGPLGLPTDAGSVALLYAGMVVADYIAMLFPSRIGVSEGALSYLFHQLGLDPGIGLAIALTLRLRVVLVQSPFALVAWVSARRQRRREG